MLHRGSNCSLPLYSCVTRLTLSINLCKFISLFATTTLLSETVTIDNTLLNVVVDLCYFSSVLFQNTNISGDVCIGAASAAFGRLESCLWKLCDIKLTTKVAVYRAVILSALFHGCESWTLCRHRFRSLHKLHLRYFCHVARIK